MISFPFLLVVPMLQIRMIAAILLAPLNILFAYLSARGFGFLAFRVVGASEMLQSKSRK